MEWESAVKEAPPFPRRMEGGWLLSNLQQFCLCLYDVLLKMLRYDGKEPCCLRDLGLGPASAMY